MPVKALRAAIHEAAATGFAAAMDRAGPFEDAPRLAVAVSGGADSTAVAILADAWARQRGGSVIALIADHGLRPESAAEAGDSVSRLQGLGIAGQLLRINGLARGSAMAERARLARYRILADACARLGIVHLLTGHHAADQVETVMIRVLSNSGDRGLAAMPLVTETTGLRIIRPMLHVWPEALRALLRTRGIAWVEDPSNRDPYALRPRLRLLSAPRGMAGFADVLTACDGAGRARARAEAGDAAAMAAAVTFRPEGFALLAPGPLSPAALGAVVRAVSGGLHAPGNAQLATMAAGLRPGTVGGVRLIHAGKLGPGLLVVREGSRMEPPVAARPGAIWDGRFRLTGDMVARDDLTIGALGTDAVSFRRHPRLNSAILATLPAIRAGNILVAVPHLRYPDASTCASYPVVFCPTRPASGAGFLGLG